MKSDLIAYLKMRKKGSEIAMLKVFLGLKLFFIAMPYNGIFYFQETVIFILLFSIK